MTLTNFHLTHWRTTAWWREVDFADVSALYEALQTRFGTGVDDPKHGFTKRSGAGCGDGGVRYPSGSREVNLPAARRRCLTAPQKLDTQLNKGAKFYVTKNQMYSLGNKTGCGSIIICPVKTENREYKHNTFLVLKEHLSVAGSGHGSSTVQKA